MTLNMCEIISSVQASALLSLLTSRTGAALRTEGARPSIKDPTALVIQTWAGQLLLRLTTLARGSLPPRPPPQEGCVSTAGQNNEWMDGGREGWWNN